MKIEGYCPKLLRLCFHCTRKRLGAWFCPCQKGGFSFRIGGTGTDSFTMPGVWSLLNQASNNSQPPPESFYGERSPLFS